MPLAYWKTYHGSLPMKLMLVAYLAYTSIYGWKNGDTCMLIRYAIHHACSSHIACSIKETLLHNPEILLLS